MMEVLERIFPPFPYILKLSLGKIEVQIEVISGDKERILLNQISILLKTSADDKGLYDFKSVVFALSRFRMLGKLELVWYEPALEEAVFKTRGKSFYQLELKGRELLLKKFAVQANGEKLSKTFSLSRSRLKSLIRSLGEVLLCSQRKFQLVKELEELKQVG